MTGIVSAVSAALAGPFGWLLLTLLATLAAVGVMTVAWLIRAVVRGWKRASLVIAGVCLWCNDRGCMDPRKCRCDEPCDMPLCMARDFEVTT